MWYMPGCSANAPKSCLQCGNWPRRLSQKSTWTLKDHSRGNTPLLAQTSLLDSCLRTHTSSSVICDTCMDRPHTCAGECGEWASYQRQVSTEGKRTTWRTPQPERVSFCGQWEPGILAANKQCCSLWHISTVYNTNWFIALGLPLLSYIRPPSKNLRAGAWWIPHNSHSWCPGQTQIRGKPGVGCPHQYRSHFSQGDLTEAKAFNWESPLASSEVPSLSILAEESLSPHSPSCPLPLFQCLYI